MNDILVLSIMYYSFWRHTIFQYHPINRPAMGLSLKRMLTLCLPPLVGVNVTLNCDPSTSTWLGHFRSRFSADSMAITMLPSPASVASTMMMMMMTTMMMMMMMKLIILTKKLIMFYNNNWNYYVNNITGILTINIFLCNYEVIPEKLHINHG